MSLIFVQKTLIGVRSILLVLSFVLGSVVSPAWAEEAQPASADPVLEARVHALSLKLRCLVCQNQSIAESDADLAQDLRQQVREQLLAGKTEAQIKDFMVARYGDFVLYEPPLKGTTILLWGAPLVLLLSGLVWLGIRLKRRAAESQTPLTESERARAQALLQGGSNEGNQP